MKVRILTTKHSGVKVGDIGEVVSAMEGGYFVRLKTTYDKTFGGATDEREADVYFTKDEIQFIKEPAKSNPLESL